MLDATLGTALCEVTEVVCVVVVVVWGVTADGGVAPRLHWLPLGGAAAAMTGRAAAAAAANSAGRRREHKTMPIELRTGVMWRSLEK